MGENETHLSLSLSLSFFSLIPNPIRNLTIFSLSFPFLSFFLFSTNTAGVSLGLEIEKATGRKVFNVDDSSSRQFFFSFQTCY